MALYQKIVVKVGTNVLAKEDGTLNETIIADLVAEIAALKKENVDVILVTSGAVGAGKSLLQLNEKTSDVARRQILAALGQIKLMNIYSELFATHQNFCAQILVTKEDFRDRLHYLNIKNCFEALLKGKIVPIVNENDVVSVTELMFTDNDELAGLIASMLNSDALLILTNVDGIYDQDPQNPEAKILTEIKPRTKLENFIAPSKSSFGRGGMLTKSRVASQVSTLGITTHIANGKLKNILTRLMSGEKIGTKFLPEKNLSNIKRWLAYSKGHQKGIIFINQCAVDILISKAKATSLLPVGITKIEGDFEKGDMICVRNEQNQDIAFGLAQYGSERAREYVGQKNKKPLIHYDYLLLE